jgi:hypothetical protein
MSMGPKVYVHGMHRWERCMSVGVKVHVYGRQSASLWDFGCMDMGRHHLR